MPFQIKQSLENEWLISIIDAVAYSIFFSLIVLYSVSGAIFAELHIFIPLLNLPIFVGEIALGILLLLAAYKFKLMKLSISKNMKWVALFLAFVISKAIYGYSSWGALAFRSAAMYYYFLYAVLVYFFYNPRFLESNQFKIIAVAFLTWLAYFFTYGQNGQDSGSFTYFLLGYLLWIVACIFQLRSAVWIKIILLILAGYLVPVSELFNQSRGMLVAVLASFLFLLATFSFIFLTGRTKRLLFIIPCFALLVVTAFCLMNESGRNRLSTLLNIGKLYSAFEAQEAVINRQMPTYVPHRFPVRLYESSSFKGDFRLYQTDESKKDSKISVSSSGYDSMIQNLTQKKNSTPQLKNLSDQTNSIQNENTSNQTTSQATSEELKGQQSQFNVVWRLLIWADMWDDVRSYVLTNPVRLISGIDFGYPIRSKRQEASYSSFPIQTGWLEPHNLLFHVIYRTGLIGFLLIGVGIWLFSKMTVSAIYQKDVIGALLLASSFYWIIFSMSLVIMELPYYAIPFWCQTGLAYAYIFDNEKI